jgi:hypothetical protein
VSVPIISELRNSQIMLQRVIWLVQYFISSNDKFCYSTDHNRLWFYFDM